MSLLDFIPVPVKHAFDGFSVATSVVTFLGWFTLSNIATILSIVWLLIRIYETKTFARIVVWLRQLGRN
jgi:hypothetical protein